MERFIQLEKVKVTYKRILKFFDLRFVFLTRLCLLLFIALGGLIFSYDLPAQEKKPRTQVLNFEDELVEGTASKPELFYLLQKKNFNYKRLIRLRENFLPELRKTSEDIQLSGSND